MSQDRETNRERSPSKERRRSVDNADRKVERSRGREQDPDAVMNNSLLVRNLSYHIKPEDIKELMCMDFLYLILLWY